MSSLSFQHGSLQKSFLSHPFSPWRGSLWKSFLNHSKDPPFSPCRGSLWKSFSNHSKGPPFSSGAVPCEKVFRATQRVPPLSWKFHMPDLRNKNSKYVVILLTIPNSNCTYERRLKMYLRNTIDPKRLNNVAVMHVNKENLYNN